MAPRFKQVGQTQAELHILKFDKMDAIIRLLHQQPSLIIVGACAYNIQGYQFFQGQTGDTTLDNILY